MVCVCCISVGLCASIHTNVVACSLVIHGVMLCVVCGVPLIFCFGGVCVF